MTTSPSRVRGLAFGRSQLPSSLNEAIDQGRPPLTVRRFSLFSLSLPTRRWKRCGFQRISSRKKKSPMSSGEDEEVSAGRPVYLQWEEPLMMTASLQTASVYRFRRLIADNVKGELDYGSKVRLLITVLSIFFNDFIAYMSVLITLACQGETVSLNLMLPMASTRPQ